MAVFLDFETKSEVDLTKTGASVYARHESTDVICLAYQSLDDVEPILWFPGWYLWLLEDLYTYAKDQPVYAHNAAFEKLIWRHVMQRKYGAPPIKESQWHCTAAQAACVALPRKLEQIGTALRLPIQKNWPGHRTMLQLCKPRKPTKTNPDEWFTKAKFPDKFQTVYDYCRDDVRTEKLIHESVPKQTKTEWFVWQLDQKINDRGIPVDVNGIQQCLVLQSRQERRLNKVLSELTDGQVTAVKQRDRLLKWLNERDVNIADVQAATIEKGLRKDGYDSTTKRVLEIRQELALASTSKFKAMLERADSDGRIRGAHLYHGASTGRWAGAGIQIQNFPSRGLVVANDEISFARGILEEQKLELIEVIYGSVTKFLSSMLRPMIRAEQGKQFIVADFSGIEARVAAWISGEQRLVRAYEKGEDPYLDLASAAYGIPKSEIDGTQRFLGKTCHLGAQYGMGAKRFLETTRDAGLDLSPEVAETTIQTFRELYSTMRGYWYALNDAAISAVAQQRRIGCGAIPIVFETDSQFLYMRLPSGRKLAYFAPQVREEKTPWGLKPQLSYEGVNSYTRQWTRQRTYGGKLFENLVQAISRDLLVEAMFRLEVNGYPIIFTVHDEVVIELLSGFGCLRDVIKIMCDSPDWAKGCPVEATGFEDDCYHKGD